MKAEILSFEGVDGLCVARLGKLSSTILRLQDGSLCIYNPVAGLENQIGGLGNVSALLAPNHYHNKGLEGHVTAFPDARLYCSATARPRLAKLTGLTFEGLDELKERLADGSALFEPESLKTGEIWLQVQSQTKCALVVTDAFNTPQRSAGARANQVGLLGTFPRYGIKDPGTYKAWATAFLTASAPTNLLPCHGGPVDSVGLTARLLDLVEHAF